MKIFIDAGHNDSKVDTGAVGNGLKEQDITFAMSTLLAERIKSVVKWWVGSVRYHRVS